MSEHKNYVTTDHSGKVLYWTYEEAMEIIRGERENKQEEDNLCPCELRGQPYDEFLEEKEGTYCDHCTQQPSLKKQYNP